ncbi:alpha-L-arabinofuranosidase C-terminal domain-containing protein [Reichenbachiella ulvae]|uniref:non-reducing end alpha-L-arabinofuranosidase n=1 Tax=Reichenbachiella ulvae TaxID=2980104 RepID=A0ABT3CUI6_9BACT|nr:alpha-L-arabinofuranosidase C-terminal domain-containing protein [Reichenbachiella ulvae]MCV9387365.1 hypothetical protein [Reichenbachiella ulvae]
MKDYLQLLWTMIFGTALLSCTQNEERALTKPSIINIDLAQEGNEISEDLWGIFYEEINRSGDGGLYPEMIYNRAFEEKNIPHTLTYQDGVIKAPSKVDYESGRVKNWQTEFDVENKTDGWKLESNSEADASMKVVTASPLDPATPHSLLMDIQSNDGVKLVNGGFKGIAFTKGEKYDFLFYARPFAFTGPITASIVDTLGNVVATRAFDMSGNNEWDAYSFSFTSDVTNNALQLELTFGAAGQVCLDYISLLPQSTFMDRKGGLRKDIAQMLADLNPAFIRWPGGCVVEGCTMENRIKWWETIGPHITRKGEWDLWGYHNTYGFGYHEFLQLCEDVGASAMYVANAGVSCAARNGDYYEMDQMPEIVEQVLGSIEYAIGDVSTKWGAERAKNGHPEPFPLKYLEIGNENSGEIYAERYDMIYDAVREKYPDLEILNAHFFFTPEIPEYYTEEKIQMLDPHWYRDAEFFFANTQLFDTIPRGKFDIYAGEYACIQQGNMYGALSEAAFMTGMERNADIVKMASYAPLLENVNYRNWPTNLIHFKNDSVYGRSSYYVQKMFAENRPDVNLDTQLDWVFPEEKIIGGIGLESPSDLTIKDLIVDTEDDVDNASILSDENNWKVVKGTWTVNEEGLKAEAIPTLPQGQRAFDFEGDVTNSIHNEQIQAENLVMSFKVKRDSLFHGLKIKFGLKDDDHYFQINLFDPSWRWFPWLNANVENNPDLKLTASLQKAIKNSGGRFGRFGPATIDVGRFDKEFDFGMDKWYDIKVTVQGKLISLEVDGVSLGQIEYQRPQRQFAIAGYDKENGEVVVKVVNGEGTPFATQINLNNAANLEKTGEIIEMSAEEKDAENSFAEPMKVSPKTMAYDGFSSSFDMEFKPYSLTILKIKASK